MIDIEELRRDLHARVDAGIDSFVIKYLDPDSRSGLNKETETEAWSFLWPSGIEEYDRTSIYRDVGSGTQVRVAWGRREAWGRKDRGRVVIFGRKAASSGWWPWVEWTEADDGRWAAAIYPSGKRRQLHRGDPIPTLPVEGDIVHVGDIFESVKVGDTLRLVVSSDQEKEMALYGLHVGRQRHRV